MDNTEVGCTPLFVPVQPTKFGGEQEDVVEWLENYEMVGKLNFWNESLLCNQLPGSLIGSALLWYRTLDNSVSFNWNCLKSTLIKAFQLDLMRRLRNFEQKPNESVNSYAHAIKLLCLRVDSQMNDATIRNHFVLGLQSNLKEHVIRSGAASFEDALTVARRARVSRLVVRFMFWPSHGRRFPSFARNSTS